MYTLENGTLNAGVVFFAVALLGTLVFGRFSAAGAATSWLSRTSGRPAAEGGDQAQALPVPAAGFRAGRGGRVHVRLAAGARSWLAGPALRPSGFTNHLMTAQFWATFPGPVIAVLTFFVCGFAAVYFLGRRAFAPTAVPTVLSSARRAGCAGADRGLRCLRRLRSLYGELHLERAGPRGGQALWDGGRPRVHEVMDCISVCPKNALSFGFAGRRSSPPARAMLRLLVARGGGPGPGLPGRHARLSRAL